MHVAKCPHCGSLLRMKEPVRAGKMRCGKCGTIFVGSTAEKPDNAPSAPPTPPRAESPARPAPPVAGEPVHLHIYHQTGKPKTPIWVVPVVLVGIALIGVLVGLFVYYQSRAKVVRVDEQGQVRGVEVMNREQAQQEAEKARLQRLEAQRRRWGGAVAPSGGQEAESPPAVRMELAGPGAASAPARQLAPASALIGDVRLAVKAEQVADHDVPGDLLQINGTVTNGYECVVLSADIFAVVQTPGGQQVLLGPVVVRFLPPNGAVIFSVPCEGVLTDQSAPPRCYAQNAHLADKEVVCWEVAQHTLRRSDRGPHLFVLTGQSRNPFDKPVAPEGVYCDFLDSRGVRLLGAQGELVNPPKTLGPGKIVDFRVELDAEKVNRPKEIFSQFRLRMVGRIP
ncbi:MAG TPA: hypothetical protein DCX07_06935 [Phycisphaerales bacterium]|nr:hypothetical protein [Phycisphaerales bacterium]